MLDAVNTEIPMSTVPQAKRKSAWMSGLTSMLDAPFWKNALVALTGATGINLFFALIAVLGGESIYGNETLRSFMLGVAIATSLWLSMGYLNGWLAARIDWLSRPWVAFAKALSSNIVVAVLTQGIVYFFYFVVFGDETPLSWLKRQRFEHYIGSLLIGLLITAIYQSAYFLGIWKQSVVQAEKLKSANLNAKYEALNAQINPHFLFNSLNVLSALVRRDTAQAEQFIQGLSEVYRYVLEVRQEPMVSLARELQALYAYAKLVQTRFGDDRLVIDVALEPQEEVQVVPLALQMLVENAVKHNGATRATPLHINIYAGSDYICVSNNLVPLYETVAGSGIGLENIRARYQLVANREIVIEQTAETYTVKLPLLKTES